MSQNRKILNHLKRRGPLTPLEALRLYGCMRLASRIDELRKKHRIRTDMVRRGGKVFARYRLA